MNHEPLKDILRLQFIYLFHVDYKTIKFIQCLLKCFGPHSMGILCFTCIFFLYIWRKDQLSLITCEIIHSFFPITIRIFYMYSIFFIIWTFQFPSVVNINVGGKKFATRLSTLLRFPESMLAAMFSGRHDVDMDADNNYFIDRFVSDTSISFE